MHFRNLNIGGRKKKHHLRHKCKLAWKYYPLTTVCSHTLPLLPPTENGRYDIGCVYIVPSICVKFILGVLISYRHRVIFFNTICKADIICGSQGSTITILPRFSPDHKIITSLSLSDYCFIIILKIKLINHFLVYEAAKDSCWGDYFRRKISNNIDQENQFLIFEWLNSRFQGDQLCFQLPALLWIS